MLTKGKADAIVKVAKEIRERVSWLTVPTRGGTIQRLRVSVVCPSMNLELDLRGFIGRTNYGFTLLYETYPIREYHYHAKHHNPGCEVIIGRHKHYWDERFGRQMAYIPSDISPSGNIDEDFYDFLRECNIAFKGKFERPLGSL